MGADAFLHMQKRSLETVRQETHAEALASANAEFEARMKTDTARLLADKIKAEEALRAANQRVEAMEAAAASVRSTVRSELKEQFADALKGKDEQIAKLQQTLEKQMDNVSTKVEGLQNSITRTFSSSKQKGEFGETLMESLLKKAYDCDILVVAKEAQTADIRMTRGNCPYFWESKNYTRMVSSEEVEKFRRDMRLHPDVIGGCLVSLRTGIAGKSRGGDIDVEFLEDGRFILFLSNLMTRDDPVFYLQTLRPLFETVESMAKPVKEDAVAIRALEAKGLLITNLLRSHIGGITKHKNSIIGHRRRMDAMFTEFQGYILESEAQLQTLLRVAAGDVEQVQEDMDTELASTVFKKERLTDCDERQKDFMKWLLGVAVAEPGTQLELKDLIEKAKPEFGERAVRGFREDLFQESAWPKGSRFIMGIRMR
jgi:chaperonin cofactor prefoldin